MKKRLGMRGKIDEIIYVRLEAGEDFAHALWDICKEYEIKTGVLLDATGNFAKVRMMRISRTPQIDKLGSRLP
ncbi:putative DNA-binding protein with PD1-like motif [Bradyrhizobium sp. GM6.1]